MVLEYLREFNAVSVTLRLMLALAAGGFAGYGRARKKQNAGLRTYMLVCLGSALTVLISQYEYDMLTGQWADIVAAVGMKFDAARYSSGVISGIGFLAAGTIIDVAHRQISGLTTAVGLFGSAAMGLACGAGFYEAVILMLLGLVFSMEILHPLESAFKRRLRNIDITVELTSINELDTVMNEVRSLGGQIFDTEMEGDEDGNGYPSVILSIKLEKGNASHSAMLSSLAELDCVYSISELIS